MTDQAVMGDIKCASPAATPAREAGGGGGWVPPREDFDGDGRGDEGGRKHGFKIPLFVNMLFYAAEAVAIGFSLAIFFHLWHCAAALFVIEGILFFAVLFDTWLRFRQMDKAHVRTVAIIKMVELSGSGADPAHYRERYELYRDMKNNPGKYLKTLKK